MKNSHEIHYNRSLINTGTCTAHDNVLLDWNKKRHFNCTLPTTCWVSDCVRAKRGTWTYSESWMKNSIAEMKPETRVSKTRIYMNKWSSQYKMTTLKPVV